MLSNHRLLFFALLFLIFLPTSPTAAKIEGEPFQIVALAVNVTGPEDFHFTTHEALRFKEVGEIKHFHYEECIEDAEILIYDLKVVQQLDGIVEFSGEALTVVAPDCRVKELGTVVQIEPSFLPANRDAILQHSVGAYTVEVAVSNKPYICVADIDADCDMLPNEEEQRLVDGFKPQMVFSPEEPLTLDDIQQVYQVSPTVITTDGPQGAMLTIVTLYTQDLGIQEIKVDDALSHLTCNAAVMTPEILLGLPPVPVEGFTALYNMLGLDLGAHCGDSEAMRVEFEKVDGNWQPINLHIKRHYDDWEVFPFHAPPYEYADDSHVKLYVSAAKHAAYPSIQACTDYTHDLFSFGEVACTFSFERCGMGEVHTFDIPFELNVGERHHPAFDALAETALSPIADLFPNELTWTDEHFCGGCDDPKAGFLGEACGGALAGKWLPSLREERPDFYVPTSQIRAPLIEIIQQQPVGEWGWATSDPVPYTGFSALATGHGALTVRNVGGSPYAFYLHGECGNAESFAYGIATGYYEYQLPSAHYDICNGQGKLGEVTVYEGQQSVVELDTGQLSVHNIGSGGYDIYPFGTYNTDIPPIYGVATERYYYGLKTGVYEIYSGQGYLGRVTIYRGQETKVTLATGQLTIQSPGGGAYQLFPAGYYEEGLSPIVERSGITSYSYGLRNGKYDLYWDGHRVGRAEVFFGQRSDITLNYGIVRVLDMNGRGYGIYEIGGDDWLASMNFADWSYTLRAHAYVLRVTNQPPLYFVVRQGETIEININ